METHVKAGLYPAASRIVLDVDPRVNADELSDFYRLCRVKHTIRRDREVGPKQLALARFVERHWRPGTSWAKLRDLWNDEHREDGLHYEDRAEDEYANKFATEARRAWSTITGMDWPVSRAQALRLRGDSRKRPKTGGASGEKVVGSPRMAGMSDQPQHAPRPEGPRSPQSFSAEGAD